MSSREKRKVVRLGGMRPRRVAVYQTSAEAALFLALPAHPLLAGLLRAIKSGVSDGDQCAERIGEARRADADRQCRRRQGIVLRFLAGCDEACAQAVADRHGFVDSGVRQQQRELVTAIAREEILRPQAHREHLRDAAENSISDEMAVA